MARETSITAFNTIRENGLLSARRLEVYGILFLHGPLTGAAVASWFYADRVRGCHSETIRNRITELRDWGVVAEVGYQIDTTTGMRVILWDVTSRLPVKPPKKESKDQTIRRLTKHIELLEKEINHLVPDRNKWVTV